MISIKKLVFFSAPSLLAILFSLAAFEFYLYSNIKKFHSYGWVVSNSIKSQIDACRAKGVSNITGVFGDSFVEYFIGTENNIVNRLQDNLKNRTLCNFGLSGTGLDVYLARFKEVIGHDNKMTEAIFYLYEGNDFFEVNKYDPTVKAAKFDRKNHILFDLFKSSRALNFIWREVIKKNLKRSPTNIEEVVKTYKFESCNTDSDYISKKLESMPKDILKNFESNQLNTSWFHVALVCPEYFKLLARKEVITKDFVRVKTYIEAINGLAEKKGIKVSIVIIPHDFYTSNSNKEYWTKIFQFDNDTHTGITLMSDKIRKTFSNVTYAEGLVGSDYIELDGHLTPDGLRKLANFTAVLMDKSN